MVSFGHVLTHCMQLMQFEFTTRSKRCTSSNTLIACGQMFVQRWQLRHVSRSKPSLRRTRPKLYREVKSKRYPVSQTILQYGRGPKKYGSTSPITTNTSKRSSTKSPVRNGNPSNHG